MRVTTCDIAVVGAGAAGCIVASRLARESNAHVVLIEAGSSGQEDRFVDPSINSIFKTWYTESDWQIASSPQMGLGGRVVTINQGKVVGGGTAINALMYVRGHHSNFEEWHRFSGMDSRWSPTAFEQSFHALEGCHSFKVNTSIRGTQGPVRISETPHPSNSAKAFLDACLEVGYTVADFNGASQDGTASLMQLILQPDGTRCSTARAYLSESLPANLELLCDTRAVQLRMRGSHCEGIALEDGSVVISDRTIVCAGALQTPVLLMDSGIGDQQLLEAAGISCNVSNPQIGKNLSDHMRVMLAYRSGIDPGVTEYLCEAALFAQSGLIDRPETDLQINFSAGVAGFVPPEFIPEGTGQLKYHSIFVPIITRPLSRGEISPKPGKKGEGTRYTVDPAYLTREEDVNVYCKGLDLARQLARTGAMKPYCEEEICPGNTYSDIDYLRRYATTIWHPVGTCSVGASNSNLGACSPDFRVNGTENVFVADASVIPSLPSGNPQAAIFALANIAANSLLS